MEEKPAKAVKVTPEMEEAGSDVISELLGDDVSDLYRARRIFEAMLAAAPIEDER